jgi:hypothetical protein
MMRKTQVYNLEGSLTSYQIVATFDRGSYSPRVLLRQPPGGSRFETPTGLFINHEALSSLNSIMKKVNEMNEAFQRQEFTVFQGEFADYSINLSQSPDSDGEIEVFTGDPEDRDQTFIAKDLVLALLKSTPPEGNPDFSFKSPLADTVYFIDEEYGIDSDGEFRLHIGNLDGSDYRYLSVEAIQSLVSDPRKAQNALQNLKPNPEGR